jgi:hypothetical protein
MKYNAWFDPKNRRFITYPDGFHLERITSIFFENLEVESVFRSEVAEPYDYYVHALRNDWVTIEWEEDTVSIFGDCESIRKNWKHLWEFVEDATRVILQEARPRNLPFYVGVDEDIYYHVEESGRRKIFNLPSDRHALKKFIQGIRRENL